MNVFGMVTTGPAHAYTPYALASFFETTPFGADDRFVLIDNDGSYRPPPDGWPQVTYLANPVPAGFAANVNQVLRLARACGAGLFFLNNDLIFTPGWLEPLQVREPALLSPVSNFQFPVRVSDWWCGPLLDLADYLGHEDQLRALVRAHGERHLVVTHIFGGLAVTFESQGVRELVQHLPTHRRNRLMPNRLRRCV
jgi:hypothetical protein